MSTAREKLHWDGRTTWMMRPSNAKSPPRRVAHHTTQGYSHTSRWCALIGRSHHVLLKFLSHRNSFRVEKINKEREKYRKEFNLQGSVPSFLGQEHQPSRILSRFVHPIQTLHVSFSNFHNCFDPQLFLRSSDRNPDSDFLCLYNE